MQEGFVQIDHVVKRYKTSASPAINKVSLTIEKGSVFGLLGPNGAGKTTLISMLCALFRPDEGKISVGGFDSVSRASSLKQMIGVVPQEIALYSKLTPYENLIFLGHMYGIETSDLKKRIEENLQILGLANNKDQQVKTFSGGMKRRVNLIAGLLHHPQLLILDEPTVGVDIQSKTAIIDLLKRLNKERGMTIFYTSHHLDEAQDFCTDIAIIDEGKIVATGKTDELIRENNCEDLEGVYLKITGKRFRDQ
jgi:ABC-2 type transport system ATP-binding protein